jgi:hypothetical protein
MKVIPVASLPWWGDVLFALAAITAVWGFLSLVGLRTHFITSKTDRRAEDLYPRYADTGPRRRRHARDHGDKPR